MLARLSGRSHQVLSAVALVTREREAVRLSRSTVTFRETTGAERAAYCRSGEPLDKAGAYAIQGLGAVFVMRLEGSYSGVRDCHSSRPPICCGSSGGRYWAEAGMRRFLRWLLHLFAAVGLVGTGAAGYVYLEGRRAEQGLDPQTSHVYGEFARRLLAEDAASVSVLK